MVYFGSCGAVLVCALCICSLFIAVSGSHGHQRVRGRHRDRCLWLPQLICCIPISISEDCAKRHRLWMMIGLGFMAVGSLLPLAVYSPVAYVLSRGMAGMGAYTWVSYTVTFTENHAQSKMRMGQLMAANNLGIFISYLVGSWLYELVEMQGLFVISAAAPVVCIGLLLAWKTPGQSSGHAFELNTFLRVLRDRHL